jgi:hypothetical protein
MPFEIDLPVVPFGATSGMGKEFPFPVTALSSVIDISRRLGQASVEIGASVGGAVQHVISMMPMSVPCRDGQIRRPPLPPTVSVGDSVMGLFVERAAVHHFP